MDALVYGLISICIFVAVVWLVIWVLGQIGVPLPGQVIKILWVIVGLLCFLWLYHVFTGGGGGFPMVHLPR